MHRRLPLLMAVVGSLLVTACTTRTQQRTLGGRNVTVVIRAGSDPGLPTLLYETKPQMEDAEGLVSEAAAIWQDFRDTEPRLSKADSVAMSAREAGKAGAAQRSWHFVIRRNADGTWPSKPQGWLAGT
jgi:hypothetical protein